MARKTKAQKAAEAEARAQAREDAEEAARIDDLRRESLKAHREIDALLWECVDSVSRTIFKLMTLNLKGGVSDDVASNKVRSRVPTAITIAYDDGFTYHAKRRLGGVMSRPVILEFEHSDPRHVGTVTEAIEYSLGETVATVSYPRRDDEDGED